MSEEQLTTLNILALENKLFMRRDVFLGGSYGIEFLNRDGDAISHIFLEYWDAKSWLGGYTAGMIECARILTGAYN